MPTPKEAKDLQLLTCSAEEYAKNQGRALSVYTFRGPAWSSAKEDLNSAETTLKKFAHNLNCEVLVNVRYDFSRGMFVSGMGLILKKEDEVIIDSNSPPTKPENLRLLTCSVEEYAKNQRREIFDYTFLGPIWRLDDDLNAAENYVKKFAYDAGCQTVVNLRYDLSKQIFVSGMGLRLNVASDENAREIKK